MAAAGKRRLPRSALDETVAKRVGARQASPPSYLKESFQLGAVVLESCSYRRWFHAPGMHRSPRQPVRELDDGKENQQHEQGTYRGFDHYRPLFFAGDAQS